MPPGAAPPDAVHRMASVQIDTSLCKYSSVRRAADGEEDCNDLDAEPPKAWTLCWTDTSDNHERVAALGPLQKLNHFVDMILICRKARVACVSVVRFLPFVEVFFTFLHFFTFPATRSGQAKSHRGSCARARVHALRARTRARAPLFLFFPLKWIQAPSFHY